MCDGKKTQSDGFGGDLPAGMEKYPREFPHRRVNEKNNQPQRERGVYTWTTQTQQDIIPRGGEEMRIHKVTHI